MTGTGPNALPDAVVFDFDGLIVDTETPIYRAAAEALAGQGFELSVPQWAATVGHGEATFYDRLAEMLGAPVDRVAYDAAYARTDRSWRDRQPPLPGVVELLDELAAAGVPFGIASSSPAPWIEGHLDRLGLRDRFATIVSADRVDGRAKPEPDTYRLACRDLDADPGRSVALEDSRPGIVAAHAAGLAVVVVPSEITTHTDLSAADLTVATLADLTLADLTRLIA